VTGLTVLPGLIDQHTHMGILSVGDPEAMPSAVVAAHLFRNAELCLLSGIPPPARSPAPTAACAGRSTPAGLPARGCSPPGRRCASPAATGTSGRRFCPTITTRACRAWRR
jgi:hypothetical protein